MKPSLLMLLGWLSICSSLPESINWKRRDWPTGFYLESTGHLVKRTGSSLGARTRSSSSEPQPHSTSSLPSRSHSPPAHGRPSRTPSPPPLMTAAKVTGIGHAAASLAHWPAPNAQHQNLGVAEIPHGVVQVHKTAHPTGSWGTYDSLAPYGPQRSGKLSVKGRTTYLKVEVPPGGWGQIKTTYPYQAAPRASRPTSSTRRENPGPGSTITEKFQVPGGETLTTEVTHQEGTKSKGRVSAGGRIVGIGHNHGVSLQEDP